MRDRARVVIIGGGVGGTSIAYHLAQLGWTDVVLVDRDQLTSGSTFHSAGLVGQLRSSVTLTRMMMYGTDLYRRLRRRDRPRPRLARGRVAAAGVVAGAARGAAPPGRLGVDVRAAARVDLHRASASSCSTVCSTRPACSARCTCRPTASSTRPISRWRSPPARAPAASRSPRTAGHRHRRRRAAAAAASRTSRPTQGRDRVRDRRQRRRHVQPRDRPHGRRQRADRADGPPVRDHPAGARPCHATCRRCATPTGSCTSARRSAA